MPKLSFRRSKSLRQDFLVLSAVLLVVIAAAGLFAGWVMNIVALWNIDAFTGHTALRIVGNPIWPLGAVLGWF